MEEEESMFTEIIEIFQDFHSLTIEKNLMFNN